MTNRNQLLGRSKPSEKLTREEIADLDTVTTPPPTTQPALNPPRLKLQVSPSAIQLRWTALCPSCGRKAGGQGESEARAAPGPVRRVSGGALPGRCPVTRKRRKRRPPAPPLPRSNTALLVEAVGRYWSGVRKPLLPATIFPVDGSQTSVTRTRALLQSLAGRI